MRDLGQQTHPAQGNLPPQTEAFSRRLDELAQQLPEVAGQRDEIAAKGAELTDAFGIQPEFFDDPAHALFFTAIAHRYATLESQRETLSTSQYERGREFVADATALLAGDKSSLYPETESLINGKTLSDTEEGRAILDKFTNPEESEELERAMRQEGGLLAGVRQRLGVTAESEDAFTVRVLNIGSGNNLPSMEPFDFSRPYSDPEYVAWRQRDLARVEYRGKILAGHAEFSRLTGVSDIPAAWTSIEDGKAVINIPSPAARLLLHPEQAYTTALQVIRQEEFEHLEHEFVHTQGGLNVDRRDFFGAAVEELRAEYFSGDKHGYNDVKDFFRALKRETGIDVQAYMRANPKGGEITAFHQEIARQVGLQGMLEIALTPPKRYVDPSRVLQQSVVEYLGEGKDVLHRLQTMPRAVAA